MESLIFVAALALLGALFVRVLARACRRVAHDGDAMPLLALLRSAAREPNPEAAARALRRCTFCSAGESCRQRIAAGLPRVDCCPNAEFLAHL